MHDRGPCWWERISSGSVGSSEPRETQREKETYDEQLGHGWQGVRSPTVYSQQEPSRAHSLQPRTALADTGLFSRMEASAESPGPQSSPGSSVPPDPGELQLCMASQCVSGRHPHSHSGAHKLSLAHTHISCCKHSGTHMHTQAQSCTLTEYTRSATPMITAHTQESQHNFRQGNLAVKTGGNPGSESAGPRAVAVYRAVHHTCAKPVACAP